MSEQDERTRIAFHEAGHTVLGWTYGLSFDGVSIVPNEGSRGRMAGISLEGVTGYGDEAEEALQEAYGSVMLAGEVAVEILTGEAIDWDEWRHFEGSDINLYTELAFERGWFERGEDKVLDLRERMSLKISEVRDLLQERWSAVEAVAAALLEREELSKDEVARIVEGTDCPGPIAKVWEDFQEERRIEELWDQLFAAETPEERKRLFEQLPEEEQRLIGSVGKENPAESGQKSGQTGS